MFDNKKLLMSIGTAIAASKVAKTLASIEFEDVLGTVGLTRRRSHLIENLAHLGVGALVGASAALLLAPMTGRDTRQRIGEKASQFGQAAKEALREQKEEAYRALSEMSRAPSASQHS